MSTRKRYRFNSKTLTYELHRTSFSTKFLKSLLFVVSTVGLFFLYLSIYSNVLQLETPKMKILKRQATEWHARLDILNKRFEKSNAILNELEMRDNIVYRPIFGMEEISKDVRDAGFGGIDRYSYLANVDYSGLLTSTTINSDILSKKAYVQSRSLDDIAVLATKAGEMAQCIPSIPPVTTDSRVRFASRFGIRLDPVTKSGYKMHTGVDFAGPSSEPIFATGNGVVQKIGFDFFGYGHFVIVDHGFGYKTRYAHLKGTLVSVGQKVTRGEQIGEMGNTGRSLGTHLHYEVIYKNKTVNPDNYYNSTISPDDYALMVKPKRKAGV